MKSTRCTATVAVRLHGVDVTLTVEGTDLDRVLNRADLGLQKLRQRGAEPRRRYVLAVCRMISKER